MMDPYEVLELPHDADADQVKKAYRKLARRWHPDVNDSPEAESRFKEVAAAFEILGDPTRRRAHDGAAGRVARGELPEAFLDHVMSAIERAQIYAERVFLPHHVPYLRGDGAEMAARMWRALEQQTGVHGTPGWMARRRARALADRIHVTMETWPSQTLSSVHRTLGGGWQITLTPWALHRAGFTESAEIDDAMLKVVLARYAQVLSAGQFLPPADPADWDSAIAAARLRDSRVLLQRWGQRAFWGAVAGLMLLLMYAGFAGW